MLAWPSTARRLCPGCSRRHAALADLLLGRQRRHHSTTTTTTQHSTPTPTQQQQSKKKRPLADGPARTRFAPSPTGFLHLGSLRTALFNYLLARATGGQFLLRLEDTDRTRLVPGAEDALYDDLRWAGLRWDEGPDVGGTFGPYRQSERLAVYREYVDQLLAAGRAYRCFCTREELAAQMVGDEEGGPGHARYPGTCSAVSSGEAEDRAARGEAHVVRFRSSSTPVRVPDLVYRGFRKKVMEDDFVIMKSDGFPTYHFANVVDDHLMGITHVIRGAEWLVSTPMHCDLYDALGWKQPIFAHVGLLVNTDRQKLSKRNSDIQISSYRDQRILPDALLDFVAHQGWRAPFTKGVLTLPDLVEYFDLQFTKGDTVTDLDKLDSYQAKHLRQQLDSPSSFGPSSPLAPFVASISADIKALETSSSSPECTPELLHPALRGPVDAEPRLDYVHGALRLMHKVWPVDRVLGAHRQLFWRPTRQALSAWLGPLRDALGSVVVNGQASDVRGVLELVGEKLRGVGAKEWRAGDGTGLSVALAEIKTALAFRDAQGGDVPNASYKLWRWFLAASDAGPPVNAILVQLGREEVLARLDVACELAAQPYVAVDHDRPEEPGCV